MLVPTRFLPGSLREKLHSVSIFVARVQETDGEDRIVFDDAGPVVKLGPATYPRLPQVTDQEAKALRLMTSTPHLRNQGFEREGLGRYGPENEVVRSLGAKGYLYVGRLVRPQPLLEVWLLNDRGGLPL